MNAPTLVVGAGGMLGRHVLRRLTTGAGEVIPARVPWNDPLLAAEALQAHLDHLIAAAGSGPWRVCWVAGAGVVGTTPDVLAVEIGCFASFVDRLSALRAPVAARGAMVLASSAGGVYAGSTGAPFTEDTVPHPLAAYGHHKLHMEQIVVDLTRASGMTAMLARISNLYGPGQDLKKPQGLVSQIARASLTRQPISIYVPIDTMRDYLYVDDGAAMIAEALILLTSEELRGGCHLKILAAGRTTTVGALIRVIERIFKRRPPVIFAQSPNSRLQVRDLRLRSVRMVALDGLAGTALPAGVFATTQAVARQLHVGA
ncbi:NAD(P)-dependent oxidoreductase [Mumia sp. zg.B21]|uniref:NAD-dependent epimerase/dehydratase family protein n=1 Tax=Mumia sp. zg.B21 TaxID=2855447 RepID=UPI001C6ED764|nr:NAD(P)-dependent oxidoreductase [Mumia sp. zg.B21]MBW9209521.1 NAD(P)-dependent oxidoreductase [Mumia sp. zg.B21]